eukprot:TRINITY_DN40774_c0_g1_i1.p1 TRINITY_DN40774_c0_g1~~TRINITY_DN40774_c0_g1_i1.p1  ORF type:complete len:530 (+),score=173.55 TRINITY_DN40774_c0_g1_i1:51-1640(+)
MSSDQEPQPLRDVLERLGVCPELLPFPSARWRCRVAGPADDDAAVAAALLSGAPCHPPSELVSSIHEAADGDGVTWITRPEWNDLPTPKLAFNSRWGKPGSSLVDPTTIVPVRHFSDIVSHGDGDSRNLQMFHRDSADEPALPCLPRLLKWPLQDVLAAPDGDLSDSSPDYPAVVLDRATRLSQRGALTCWHLDDCGELVYQTALPCADHRCRGTVPRGPSGRPIVKLFILAPRWAYDWVSQDQVQQRTGAFAQLDLWSTPEEALPADRADMQFPDMPAGEVLPELWVALVEAGGRPLLLPPNLPHTVLTLQDCVLTEERRLSRYWLDDVHYFEERNRLSKEQPIKYKFVGTTLRDPARVSADVVAPLLAAAADDSKPGWLRGRALSALSVLMHPSNEQGGTCELTAEDRRTVASALAAASPARDSRHEEVMTMLRDLGGQSLGITKLHGVSAWMAYCHDGGAPRFGPIRRRQQRAAADRRALNAAAESASPTDAVRAELLRLAEAGDDDGAAAQGAAAEDKQLMDELF